MERQRFNPAARSEEHTSELQSHVNLVCRLLLEQKNPTNLMAPQVDYYVPEILMEEDHHGPGWLRDPAHRPDRPWAGRGPRDGARAVFFLLMRRPPISTLFPYTTLFR